MSRLGCEQLPMSIVFSGLDDMTLRRHDVNESTH